MSSAMSAAHSLAKPNIERFHDEDVPSLLVAHFQDLVRATGSTRLLKQLALHLAMQGRLSDGSTESVESLRAEIRRARGRVAKSGVRVRDVPPIEECDVPWRLPTGWSWVRLGELGGFLGGGTPSKSNSSFWEGPLPWVSPKDMKQQYIEDAAEHISMAAVDGSAAKLIPKGSILCVVRGMILAHSFPVALTQREVTINQDMKALVLAVPAIGEFVLRACQEARARVLASVERSSHGTCRLDGDVVENLLIPLPPLAEQKRIVAKLDQLMALCDELEARQTRKRDTGTRLTKSALEALSTAESPKEFDLAWNRVAENFDVLIDRAEKVEELRRAVLRLALTGRLVSADHSDWPRIPLGDAAEARLGKMLDKVKNRGEPFPYLRNTNVHWFRLQLDSIKEMPFTEAERDEYALRAGDLLVCEGGHGIGRTAVWNGERTPMMFQKALHRLRPGPSVNSLFLAYQLKVAADTGVMARYFTGAGIPHLTGRRLAEMEVVVPPRAIQDAIVAKVQRLMKLCDDLDARLTSAEERASKLVEAVVRDLVA